MASLWSTTVKASSFALLIVGAGAAGCTSASSLSGSKQSGSASQSSGSGPGPGSDSEGDPANQPQQVSGAYLLDCGPAGQPGYGCVIHDANNNKANAPVTQPVVTVNYTGATIDKPAVTLAAAGDPWSFYFQPLAGLVPQLQGVTLSTTLGGQAFSTAARTVTYDPTNLPAVSAPTFGPEEIFFVTSAQFIPGLMFSSVAQADFLCSALAQSPHSILPQGRTWASTLAYNDPTQSPSGIAIYQRLPIYNGNSINSLGTIIDNGKGSVSGSGDQGALILPINLDEAGHPIPATDRIWTGANADGSPNANTCNNWTSSLGQGAVGAPTIGDGWDNAGSALCASAQHLYCAGYTQ